MSYWYDVSAPEDDIVVSTRIRLARNINGIPFPHKMTAEQFERVNLLVKNAVLKNNLPITSTLRYFDMDDIPEIERLAMVERHIISQNFALNYQNRAIIISDDESICVMLGEEDHIRIQVLLAGLQLHKAYEIANLLDDILCSELDIAFDEHFGFLTECPTNLGTGLRASVMLHLPVIKDNHQEELFNYAKDIGYTVRGIYGEGSKPEAALYQFSNQVTLGINEKDTVNNLKEIAISLIKKEKDYRKNLDSLKTEDICMRSLGVLKSARLLSTDEMMSKLSHIMLAKSMHFISCDSSPIKLMIEGKPNMIMRRFGELSPNERDFYRAKMIREQL